MPEYSVINYGAYSLADAFFQAEVEKVCRKYATTVSVTTEEMKVDEGTLKMVLEIIEGVTEKKVNVTRSKIELYHDSDYLSENLIEDIYEENFAVIVDINMTNISFRMMSNDREKAVKWLEAIIEKVPIITTEKDQRIVPFNFWNIEPSGVHHSTKNITCPFVSEIEGNYPKAVMKNLKYLMELERPDAIGKIIIFSGPPGTGKTTAVRSLAREWAYKLGASVEIFLDPEELLASSGYMNKVILDVDSRVRFTEIGDDDNVNDDFDDDDLVVKAADSNKIPRRDRLRLVIIEDSADLVSSNCRDKIGFSRFLNVTDGIIGQGLRHVFLITANEELGRLDPAVTRRGRCIKSIVFPTFTKKEGIDWLKANGVPDVPLSELTDEVALSDLYAIKAGLGVEEEKKTAGKFGFN